MASTATTTTLRALQPPSTSKPPRTSANPPPDPPNANPNPIPDSNPLSAAAESNPLAPSHDEVALSRATHLTRPEVLRLRSRRLKQLARCYRDHYWALMEELKVQYREYYWEYGVSPYRELPTASEKEAREPNPQELEYSGNDTHNNPNPKNNIAATGASGKGDADAKSNNPRCAFVGCKLKAMALTSFCHLHILSDSKQKLYKPCSYVIKSAQAGPITCGKPILRSTVPSLCAVHFQKAQKHVTRALKKAGLSGASSNKLAPNFHIIVAEYVRQIQAKRRAARVASEVKVEVDLPTLFSFLMADYRFLSRSRNPSYESYPWDEEWTYSSDLPTHPVRMDPDGRKYGMAWNPGQKPNGGYLVQTETYVVYPPPSGGYGYASKADHRMNNGSVDYSTWDSSSLMPTPYYVHSPEVEGFLTRVQAEASQPLGFSPPDTRYYPYYRDQPKYEEHYTRYRNEGGRPAEFGVAPPARANSARNPDPVSHCTYPAQPGYHTSWHTRIKRSTIEPSSALGLGRWGNYPGKVNQYRQPGRDSSLSKPIDDIDKIIEYLKQAAKPLSEPNPAIPERDAAPEVSGTEDAVKPQSNSKSSPEPKAKVEAEPMPTTDAAHMGTVTSREAVSTTADMAHSTGTMTSGEAAEKFHGILM